MVPPFVARRWARQLWLRRPEQARSLLCPGTVPRCFDGPSLALLAWITLVAERDEKEAELLAREALRQGGDTRFASAALAEALLRRGEFDEAVAVVEEERRRRPDVPWYELTLADALIEAGHLEHAERLLEAATERAPLRRHALKRLARLAYDRGDTERARRFFEDLVALAPDYLVYASDYVALGSLQLQAGEGDAAHRTWRRGAEIYSRHQLLRRLLQEHFGDDGPPSAPRVPPVAEDEVGARRIPVRTRFITPRTGILEVVEEATAGLRRPGDVIAVSESAAAAGQGRIVPLELVCPSMMAVALCRFVGQLGPLHSPQGMQGAIWEAGRARVAVGAAAAAAGKVFGRRGWFYRVAGPGTAMIDDVASCLPPHDHHLVFGPARPDALASQLASALDCGVAIVDANHRSGAWVVGASAGIDRQWLSRALADNPAGNEDEQTPVVIVRPLGTSVTTSPMAAAVTA